jgi:uncharacterized Fe-S cluster-containing protein
MNGTNDQRAQLVEELPGLDCGICGYKSCEEFARLLVEYPEEARRCTHLAEAAGARQAQAGATCSGATGAPCQACDLADMAEHMGWQDSLGRDYDFVLDTFPNEPGPRETILPHNPQLTKDLDITVGDILIGRPLGMSCGCPITHCGVVVEVDKRNGVIVWCVTGPLNPRARAHKDIGYYSAEAYEGLVRDTRSELKIGMRYWFLPRRCMLQWRHSGLVNFVNRTKNGTQIRIEGLLIG